MSLPQLIVCGICLLTLSLTTTTTLAWPEPLVPKEFVLASNYFGFNLLNKRSTEEVARNKYKQPDSLEHENIFISPFSLTTVLAMLQQGANGETLYQLNQLLGFQLARIDDDKFLVAKRARSAILQMSSIDSINGTGIQLKMANAVIINKNFRINDAYNQTIQNYFDSELLEADFASEADLVMQTINQWCSLRTNGKIQNFLRQPPEPSTQLSLVNAVYFKGNWKYRFPANQTTMGTFYGANNETFDNVPFMRRQGRMVTAYLAELESDLIELPYEGDEVSMFVILPRQNTSNSLTYVRKALNPWYVEAAISRLNEEENEATVVFPKLNIVGRYSLKETLKDMGLVDIFDYGQADLSGINDEQAISVDDVRHAAVIDINEDGTEAAASTYVGFVKMSLQPSSVYELNRPFVLFIRHNSTGQVLFVGEINKP